MTTTLKALAPAVTLFLCGSAFAAGPIITGGGRSTEVWAGEDGVYLDQTTTVSAVEHKDGSVSGHVQMVFHGFVFDDGSKESLDDSRAHISVECDLDVGDGFHILAGEITETPFVAECTPEECGDLSGASLEGLTGLVGVRDGGTTDDDAISFLIYFGAYLGADACDIVDYYGYDEVVESYLGPLSHGNIVAR